MKCHYKKRGGAANSPSPSLVSSMYFTFFKNKKKIADIPEFFKWFNPPWFLRHADEFNELELALQDIIPDIQLWFHAGINRYILYKPTEIRAIKDIGVNWKELQQTLTRLMIIEGKKHSYREPGFWLIPILRQKDLTKNGSVEFKTLMEIKANQIMAPTPKEKQLIANKEDILQEFAKDLYNKLRGRKYFIISSKVVKGKLKRFAMVPK